MLSAVADARALPLPDASVDLVCTSPPYWAQRAYTDGGVAWPGQIGAEDTPAEYLDNLLDCTREWVRVLKPEGNLWVNLGDKYATRWGSSRPQGRRGMDRLEGGNPDRGRGRWGRNSTGVPEKSLVGLPWRYALACVDELGLTLRAEVVWEKPNGLPESQTDRVRRSHEQWFHLTVGPRHYAAIDTVREPHADVSVRRAAPHRAPAGRRGPEVYQGMAGQTLRLDQSLHPLGRLPGSVWNVPTEPLDLPAHLTGEDDHYASYPPELPRRIVLGWSPERVCTSCGRGRVPVTTKEGGRPVARARRHLPGYRDPAGVGMRDMTYTVIGEECACADASAAATPGIVVDPFGGTGTTAHVAHALGRAGLSFDGSRGYARIAADDTLARRRWAKVHELPAPAWAPADDLALFDL